MKSNKEESLYQIIAPHFCAGIIVDDNIVIKAAPILRWMTGKDVSFIEEYCKRKKWVICKVCNEKIYEHQKIKRNN